MAVPDRLIQRLRDADHDEQIPAGQPGKAGIEGAEHMGGRVERAAQGGSAQVDIERPENQIVVPALHSTVSFLRPNRLGHRVRAHGPPVVEALAEIQWVPDPDRVASFQAIIRKTFPCYVRKPRGLDVYAACGQLSRKEAEQFPIVA